MRRSKEQIENDRVIKKRLLELGESIYQNAVPNSRRDTGRLQDEMNFRVYKDTNLRMWQMYYGAFNYPRGKNSGEKNALLIEVKKQVPKGVKVIASDVVSVLTKNFKK